MVELVYEFDEKSYCECLKLRMFEKVTRPLKYASKIVLVHKHTSYNSIYMDTNTDHFIPLVLRVRGNKHHF